MSFDVVVCTAFTIFTPFECVCVCVCVCERERERERASLPESQGDQKEGREKRSSSSLISCTGGV